MEVRKEGKGKVRKGGEKRERWREERSCGSLCNTLNQLPPTRHLKQIDTALTIIIHTHLWTDRLTLFSLSLSVGNIHIETKKCIICITIKKYIWFFVCIWKVLYAHQGCICLIKKSKNSNTMKCCSNMLNWCSVTSYLGVQLLIIVISLLFYKKT